MIGSRDRSISALSPKKDKRKSNLNISVKKKKFLKISQGGFGSCDLVKLKIP
jgi:hypothetical protein